MATPPKQMCQDPRFYKLLQKMISDGVVLTNDPLGFRNTKLKKGDTVKFRSHKNYEVLDENER